MRRLGTLGVICLVVMALAAGCGKKGNPVPPEPDDKTEQQVD